MVDLDTFAISFPDPEFRYAPVQPGQAVYGWPSHGVAANGYSLVRQVFGLQSGGPKTIRKRLERYWPELQEPLWRAILEPTPVWISQIEAASKQGVEFAGHAHITGGGLVENIPRILPPELKVVIQRKSWERPPIFQLIQEVGQIPQTEMDRVFNQGVMVVSLVTKNCQSLGAPAFLIGCVEECCGDEPQLEFV